MPGLRAADGPGGTHLPRAQRPSGGPGLTDPPPRREAGEREILDLLSAGELRTLGLMPRASNYTFLCELSHEDVKTLVVYKPRDGEAPLWDFPQGTLCLRETAAYLVSSALGWDFVPPTVLREGPHGFGAVQLFIDAEPGEHYLTLATGRDDVFRRLAAYDVAINNADRKSGHCLLERGGERIWVVDHGVTFHRDPKLRTVIWEFADEPLPADVVAGLSSLSADLEASSALAASLEPLLSVPEIDALHRRVRGLLDLGRFPAPGPGRPYPWPPI